MNGVSDAMVVRALKHGVVAWGRSFIVADP